MREDWKITKYDKLSRVIILSSSYCICFVISCAITTQFFAHHLPVYFSTKANLFGLYTPFISLDIFASNFMRPFHRVFFNGLMVFLICIMISIMINYFLNYILKKSMKNTTSHGSAKFTSTVEELKERGLLGPKQGFYIGGYTYKGKMYYMIDDSVQHILINAPTQSGKSTGHAIPTLLCENQSMIIHDLKGELWDLTAGFRKNELKQDVYRFCLSDSSFQGARWNPLNEIRLGPNEIKDIQNFVDILVIPSGKEMNNHWIKQAKNLLTCAILHTLYVGKNKTMNGVLNLLNNPKRKQSEILESMMNTKHDPTGERGWKDYETGAPTKTHPTIQLMAKAIYQKQYEERSAIFSTAEGELALFYDENIIKNTAVSDFRIKEFLTKKISLYITVPPDDLSRVSRLSRLLIYMTTKRIIALKQERKEYRYTGEKKDKIVVLLDEFKSLGKLNDFEEIISYAAGFQMKFIILVQDIAQIYDLYGRNESIIGNCHLRIIHAPNKTTTAREISDELGQETIQKMSLSYSDHRSKDQSINLSQNFFETQRKLMLAEEIMRLGKDNLLVLSRENPILGKKIKFYDVKEFIRRSSIEAPRASDRNTVTLEELGLNTNAVEYMSEEEMAKRNIDETEGLKKTNNEKSGAHEIVNTFVTRQDLVKNIICAIDEDENNGGHQILEKYKLDENEINKIKETMNGENEENFEKQLKFLQSIKIVHFGVLKLFNNDKSIKNLEKIILNMEFACCLEKEHEYIFSSLLTKFYEYMDMLHSAKDNGLDSMDDLEDLYEILFNSTEYLTEQYAKKYGW